MASKVLVTGATGKTGTALIGKLLEQGAQVRAASRSISTMAGIGAVSFDWYDASTHAAALNGVDAIYIVSPIGDNDPLAVVSPFIEKAIDEGISRFVLLSSSSIEQGGPATGQIHALLADKAPQWAVLRPSWFMQNFANEPHLSSIRTKNVIYSATGTGKVPFVSVDDIAAVAAMALTQPEPPERDLVITGPALHSYDDIAAVIGAARGRAVRHVSLTTEQLAQRHAQAGIPADFAHMLALLDVLIADGAEERLTDVVQRHTGRQAQRFQTFAASNRELW